MYKEKSSSHSPQAWHFFKKYQACGDDYFSLTIRVTFSTFLRFLRLPIRSRVRRPKLWVSTGFKSSSQECQNMNCVVSKKTLEASFYSFLLKSVLNAAFLTLHFNSLIFGPHEKIGNFETDPKPKIALCGDRAVWSY